MFSVNKSLKYHQNEITTSSSRSIKLQQVSNIKQSIKLQNVSKLDLKRKCKKSNKSVNRTQNRRQKNPLEKICKRQTKLKF